jgi:hypothetical protein
MSPCLGVLVKRLFFRHATDVERKPLYFPYVGILLGHRKVKFASFAGPATDHNIFYPTLFTTVRKK